MNEAYKKKPRINEGIRSQRLLVIDSDGAKLGEKSLHEALALAREQGLDLIEIAPNLTPPVAKILDYGKYKYEQSKADRRKRKSSKPVIIKEIRLGLQIQAHDMEVKRERTKEFLGKGNKVKINLLLRGRENIHSELGFELLQKFYEPLKDISAVDSPPIKQGRSLSMTIKPTKHHA